MFRNRVEAGIKLAEALKNYDNQPGIVIAIPRGGVVVGYEVARGLHLPLDIIIPRKVGAPHQPEVAIGAVTQDGTALFNEGLMNRLDLSVAEMEPEVEQVVKEIKRRMMAYRGTSELPELTGKDVILVDDGIATGATVLAALKSIKNAGCRKIILAVPVAPPDVIRVLAEEVDELVCLLSEESFYAVGQFYRDFNQTDDEEVINLLNESRSLCCPCAQQKI